jgi:catalase
VEISYEEIESNSFVFINIIRGIDLENGMGAASTETSSQTHGQRGIVPEDYPHNQNNAKVLTTNQGTPVNNNSMSLTAGPRGPVLLEDYALLEKMAQFDRERIPDRVFHARGTAAKGYFEVTHDISNLTSAALFNGVGKKTPVAVRFSTATHDKGSPESLRDVRGFAIKFYTEEGNWDLTGNNLPVFFIRDGYQFPDMVHALRPNPWNNIQEGWRILDWFSAHPEGMNLFTYLLGDEGIPTNWRTMDGFGVNTFILQNKEKETYVKFNWKSKAEGEQYMDDEAAVNAGENNMRHSHATHDLFNHIGAGKEAIWDFFIQTMDIAEGDSGKFGFDPLDCTKNWPEEQFPWQPVGRMVIDTPVSNFQNESEQIAFSPGSVVPGVLLSNDKILQTRAFSYSDAHRYRLGVNYLNIPVNAAKNQLHLNSEAGTHAVVQKNEQVNYWPSTVEHTDEVESDKATEPREVFKGSRQRSDYGSGKENIVGDDFKQPGDRIRAFSQASRDNLTKHLVAWLTDPKGSEKVANIWFDYWTRADKSFGEELKAKVLEANGGKFGHANAVPASMA